MAAVGDATGNAATGQTHAGAHVDRLPLASLITSARRRQSVSQEQLARTMRQLAQAELVYCGAHRQTINRYERGRIIPNPDTLRWLATALGMPTARLVAAADRQRTMVRSRGPSQSSTEGPHAVPNADAGLDIRWTLAPTMTLLQDWLRAGKVDQRTFVEIPSRSITAVVRQYLTLEPSNGIDPTVGKATDSLVDHVNHGIRLIRMMDDAEGGASHLSYVEAYFQAVATLVKEGGHSESRNVCLIGALAQLAQQAGWMAYDATRHGMAQRYYLSGLRLAHEAGDRPLAAHVLADIAYQSASRGDLRDGLAIAEGAVRAGQQASAGVYASVLTRVAYAHAVGGRLRDFESSCFDAREALLRRRPKDDPDWMYYMTTSHIDSLAGVSLVQLGHRYTSAGDFKKGWTLLAEGERLLRRAGVQSRSLDHPHQRRALFEDAWLALACSAQDNLQGACETARLAVRRLQSVSSVRSVVVLRVLAGDLRRRSRERHVKDFLPELDRALRDQVVVDD
ncbi:MAG: helix-turn-helix domain-containing protein [Candidatus Dormibacteraeota bacterium]|nr:helix-turn-helix domain-containing protein [Candidatus Dormibacteraeota bacterium]